MPDISSADISVLADRNTKLAGAISAPNTWETAEMSATKDIDAASTSGVRIMSVLDEEYPQLLKSTPDCPFFLYVRGAWAKQPQRAVAVIGTREPTEHGKEIAERISRFLVEDKWSIVSGLALGCDAIAHQTALREGGHTIAVLAHGPQTIAPRQHRRLAEEILSSGGALVTEYGFGVEPFAHQFVKRDRIQAGLSQGVVMIQSDLAGGSLHACRACIEYQRVLAVPVATERDIRNGENKIEANCILTKGELDEQSDLLKCSRGALNHVLVLRSKEDYQTLSKALASRLNPVNV